MPHVVRRFALAAILTALARPATAAQCNLTVTPIDFGPYSPFAGPRDGVGAVALDCNGVVSPVLQLGPGGSGNAGDRRMSASGADVLRYNVYADAARSQVFTWIALGRGRSSVPLYGRIFADQPVPPGVYQDTLDVTVNF